MDESEWLICKYCKKNFHGKTKLHLHKKNKHMAQIRASLTKRKGRDSVTPTTTTPPTTNNNKSTFRIGTLAGPSRIRPIPTTTVTPVPRKRQKRLQDSSSDSSSSSSDEAEYSRLQPEIFSTKSQSTSKAVQPNLVVSKPPIINVPTIATKSRQTSNQVGPNLKNHNTSEVTTLPKICTVYPASPQSVTVSQLSSLNKTGPLPTPIIKSPPPPIIKSPPPTTGNKSLSITRAKPPAKPPIQAVKSPAPAPAVIMLSRTANTAISLKSPCPSPSSRVKSPSLPITAPISSIRPPPNVAAQMLTVKSPPPPTTTAPHPTVKSPTILPISPVNLPQPPTVAAPVSSVKSPPPPITPAPTSTAAAQILTIKSSPNSAVTTMATARLVPKGYMPQNYQCAICGVYFITMPGMERHMKQHNNVILKVAFGCSVCKARFELESERNEHLKIHMGPSQRFARLGTGMTVLPVPTTAGPPPPPPPPLPATNTKVNNVEVVALSPIPVQTENESNDATDRPSLQLPLQQNESINERSQTVHSNDARDMKIIINRTNPSQNSVVPVTESFVEAVAEERKNEERGHDSDPGKPKTPLQAAEEGASKDDDVPKDLLLCYICAETFPTIQGLYKHIVDDHTEKQETYTCTVCTKDFDSAAALDTHKKMYHVKICEHCGRCFTTTFDLNIHLRQEHNTRAVFACSTCRIGFHLNTALIMHYKLTGHT